MSTLHTFCGTPTDHNHVSEVNRAAVIDFRTETKRNERICT